MNRKGTIRGALLVAALVLLAGCKPPEISWAVAQDRYDAHRTEKINAMYYMGSDEKDHYLHHSFLTMYETGCFRVAKSELTITNEFPVTTDKTKWRKLEMPLRVAPAGSTIETDRSEPGVGR